MLAALCGICVGVYAVLDTTAPRLLAVPMLAAGVALASAGLVSAGRRVRRTRYRPDRWRWPELVVACSGVTTGVLGWWLAGHDLAVAYPGVAVVPVLSPAVLLAAGIALGGAPARRPPPCARPRRGPA